MLLEGKGRAKGWKKKVEIKRGGVNGGKNGKNGKKTRARNHRKNNPVRDKKEASPERGWVKDFQGCTRKEGGKKKTGTSVCDFWSKIKSGGGQVGCGGKRSLFINSRRGT